MKNRQWMLDYNKIKKSLEERKQEALSDAGRCALDSLMTTDNEDQTNYEFKARAYNAKANAFNTAINDLMNYKELVELAEPAEPK